MSIGSLSTAQAGAQRPQARQSALSQAPQRSGRGPGFAELLARQERPHTGEADQGNPLFSDIAAEMPASTSATAPTAFNLAVSVEGSAIRFDARPLVGETSVDLRDDGEALSALQDGISRAADAPADREGIGAPTLADALEIVRSAAQWLVAQADAAQPAMEPVAMRSGTAMTTPEQARAPALTAPSFAAQTNASAAPAGRTATASTPAHTRPLAAQLLALPREIRVAIHGLRLTAEDIAALVDELGTLLTAAGLGGRPIHVVALSGRN